MDELTLTASRRAALELVGRGLVDFSLSMACWEPREGYRLTAYDWLEQRGLIEPDVDADPVGRVMQLVPVRLTAAGRAMLER